MRSLEIALTLTSQSALSIGAGGSAGTLADKTIVRDGWGRPVIPGSQVKGKARAMVERILRGLGAAIPAPFDDERETDTPVRRLFGSPDYTSPLRFADLPGVIGPLDQIRAVRASPEQHGGAVRPSVSINRRRGTAEDARLLLQETASELTRFAADPAIKGLAPDVGHVALLWAGLTQITRWGGASSRGLGWASLELSVRYDGDTLEVTQLQDALRAFVAEGRFRP